MGTTNKIPDAWDDDDWVAKAQVNTQASNMEGIDWK